MRRSKASTQSTQVIGVEKRQHEKKPVSHKRGPPTARRNGKKGDGVEESDEESSVGSDDSENTEDSVESSDESKEDSSAEDSDGSDQDREDGCV